MDPVQKEEGDLGQVLAIGAELRPPLLVPG